MNQSAIADYLKQLDHELRLKRAPRRRLLAEANDHLRASAAEISAGGLDGAEAEARAVARFGAAALVARRFAHAAAASATHLALLWAWTAFAGYALAAGAVGVAGPTWLRDFPQGAPSGVGLQIAAVALLLTTLRAARRGVATLDEVRLPFVANGVLTATLAVAAAAAIEFVIAATRPASAPWFEARTAIAVYAVAGVGALVAAFVAVAAFARARAVEALPHAAEARLSRETELLLVDVAAVARVLRPAAAVAIAHPAITCGTVAAVASVAVVALSAHGADGGPTAAVGGALATGVFEAAAVVFSYLALGRALGIRSEHRRVARRRA